MTIQIHKKYENYKTYNDEMLTAIHKTKIITQLKTVCESNMNKLQWDSKRSIELDTTKNIQSNIYTCKNCKNQEYNKIINDF